MKILAFIIAIVIISFMLGRSSIKKEKKLFNNLKWTHLAFVINDGKGMFFINGVQQKIGNNATVDIWHPSEMKIEPIAKWHSDFNPPTNNNI